MTNAVPSGAGRSLSDRWVEWLVRLQRRRSGLAAKTVEVAGETWHYLEGGPPTASHCLLLLHGFAAHKDNWIALAGQLTRRWRVIAVDLPGFGQSARHREWGHGMSEQRQRLHGFIQAMGLGRLHLVGNSMGGYLAASYAKAHADRVLSLALLACAGVAPLQDNEMRQAVARGENPLLLKDLQDIDRLLDFVMYRQPPMPGMVKRYLARRALEARDFNALIFDQLVDELTQGLESILPQIRVPTLVLWGRQDRVLDVSCVEVLNRLLPDVRSIILEQTGHLPQVERPRQTAEHLQAFIDARFPGGQTAAVPPRAEGATQVPDT